MRRKIVKQGASTLTISLPSAWTHRFNLSGDQEIDIEDRGSELIIRTTNPVTGPSTSFDAHALGRLVNRSVINAYHLGFDAIEVSKISDLNNPESTRILDELLGFEITDQSASTIVMKDVTGTAPKEFSNLLRRLFLQIKTLIEDGSSALAKHDLKTLQQLAAKDKEINKLTHTCLRQISKNGFAPNTQRSYSMYLTIHRLEEISDQFKVLYSAAAKTSSLSPDFGTLCNEVSSLFSSCYNFIYQMTPEKALEISSAYDDLKTRLAEHGKQNPAEIYLSHSLAIISHHILGIQGSHLGFLGTTTNDKVSNI